MEVAWAWIVYGFSSVILEGDCLSLYSKLKKQDCSNIELGTLIQDIFNLACRSKFFAFNHVKRMKNRMTHTLAHLQPFNSNVRVWWDEAPNRILNLVAQDICKVVTI